MEELTTVMARGEAERVTVRVMEGGHISVIIMRTREFAGHIHECFEALNS